MRFWLRQHGSGAAAGRAPAGFAVVIAGSPVPAIGIKDPPPPRRGGESGSAAGPAPAGLGPAGPRPGGRGGHFCACARENGSPCPLQTGNPKAARAQRPPAAIASRGHMHVHMRAAHVRVHQT